VGFTAVNAQGLTAPPFFLSFLLTCTTTYIADKTKQRGIMIMILGVVGGVGYVMLGAAKSIGARYTGVFLAAAGIFPAIANIIPWVLSKSILSVAYFAWRLKFRRQSRNRYSPRIWNRNPEPSRPMWSTFGYTLVSGEGRAILRQRPIRLRSVHVLHHIPRFWTEDTLVVGE
jgi:hypothetical protein